MSAAVPRASAGSHGWISAAWLLAAGLFGALAALFVGAIWWLVLDAPRVSGDYDPERVVAVAAPVTPGGTLRVDRRFCLPLDRFGVITKQFVRLDTPEPEFHATGADATIRTAHCDPATGYVAHVAVPATVPPGRYRYEAIAIYGNPLLGAREIKLPPVVFTVSGEPAR